MKNELPDDVMEDIIKEGLTLGQSVQMVQRIIFERHGIRVKFTDVRALIKEEKRRLI